MVALSFDLTQVEGQDKPASEKVTKHGTVTIKSSGGVGDSAYATGWKIGSNYLRYTHGDYSVATSKEHRTFIAWLAVYVTVWVSVSFVNITVTFLAIFFVCRYKGTQTIDLKSQWSCGIPIFGDPTGAVSTTVSFLFFHREV